MLRSRRGRPEARRAGRTSAASALTRAASSSVASPSRTAETSSSSVKSVMLSGSDDRRGCLGFPARCAATAARPTGDPRSDRTGRNAENFRDLGVVERADVAAARPRRGTRAAASRARRRCSAGRRRHSARSLRPAAGDRQLVHGNGPSPSPAQLVETGVGRNAVGPRRERRASVEARQPAHECQERLLRGVERVGVVAGHAPAQPVQAVVVPAQQCLECRVVTRPSGGDEGDVVRSADGPNATSP